MAFMDNRQMSRMRQDAIRRSQEMHKRSMVNSSHYSQGNSSHGDRPPEVKAESEKSCTENTSQSPRQQKKPETQLSDIIDGLLQGKLDSDKLMILLLMIVLIKEGADIKLIIALGYILL